MKDLEALEELIGYLEARRPYLPDDEARRRAGLWIASNRVEKFNDWSVSVRCKHRGMEWTAAGVVALVTRVWGMPARLRTEPGSLVSVQRSIFNFCNERKVSHGSGELVDPTNGGALARPRESWC
jgi:hypothetical protein